MDKDTTAPVIADYKNTEALPQFVWWALLLLFSWLYVGQYALEEVKPGLRSIGALIPEALSLLLFAVAIAHLGRNKRMELNPLYLLMIITYLLTLLAGWVASEVQPGAIANGIRTHLRTIPVFLLAVVMPIPVYKIRGLLLLLLFFAFLQIPVASYQRFIQYAHLRSGDPVSGTLHISSLLSIFLVCVVITIYAQYLKKRISGKTATLVCLALLLPAMLNETRGTIIILIVGLLAPAFAYARSTRSMKTFWRGLILGAMMIGVFDAIYAEMSSIYGKQNPSIFVAVYNEFVTRGFWKRMDSDKKVMAKEGVGRGDAVVLALENISKHPATFFFGMGAGSVLQIKQRAFLDDRASEFEEFGPRTTTVSYLLWEVGVLGLAAFFVTVVLVLRDAWSLSNVSGWVGAFALGWLGVTTVWMVSAMYKNLIGADALSYSYWLFSGYVARQAYRQKYGERQALNVS